jgi:hypothetical protein
MRFFLLLILFAACGPKVDLSPLPEDIATPLERERLEEVLADLGHSFAAEGVSLDLTQVPVIVADHPQFAGICYLDHKKRPRAISIDRTIVNRHELPYRMSDLHTVLLHEIGHCYFGRDHEDAWLQFPDHFLMIYQPTADHDVISYNTSLELTMMNVGSWTNPPPVIWPYFLREIAGLERFSVWQQFQKYARIDVRPYNPTQERTLPPEHTQICPGTR